MIGITMLSLLFGCKTYTITTGSFKEQMTNANSDNQKLVKIKHPPLITPLSYYSNGIEYLTVIDKENNKLNLKITPTIEMRVTNTGGKKYLFLFDTVLLENDTLKGNRSRLMNLQREIHFDSITKIEIQNSGKKIRYVN
jgi:hypothetical protein